MSQSTSTARTLRTKLFDFIFEQESGLQMIEGDCMISYLPLAHVYERLAQVRLRKLGLSKCLFILRFSDKQARCQEICFMVTLGTS